jgi:hypothetical protein
MELRVMIDGVKAELGDDSNLQLQYSNALALADLSRVELLHPMYFAYRLSR